MQQVDFYFTGDTSQRHLSDIMIVDCGNHYYVSTKIKGAVVYTKLLLERQKTSPTFVSYEQALIYAETLSKRITKQQGTECIIKNYNLQQFVSNLTKGERPYKYFIYNNVQYPYSIITEKGKEIFDYIFEEEKYRFVDKIKYSQRIQENIIINNEVDFYLIGANRGYHYALLTSLPFLYREIYLVSCMLDEDDKEDELFKNNYLYFSGYLDSIINSIQIQKECILTKGEFEFLILDFDGSGILEFNKDKSFNSIPENIKLDVIVFKNRDAFLKHCLSTTKYNLFAVITPSASINKWMLEKSYLEEKLGLIPQYFYDEKSLKSAKRATMTSAIKHCLENLFFLSKNGSISSTINDKEKKP